MSVAALHDVRPRDRGASPADLRRADWRFLLPDPSLGRVAVAGAPDAELLRALGLVAVAVTAAGVGVGGGGGGGHDVDVAVASPATPRDLAAVLGSVRPRGWVYAETTGRAAGACARALRDAGCSDVALHWLWPTAAACKEIVPLACGGAVRAALARRDPGARLRLRGRAAALASRTTGLRLLLPDVAVIGRVP